MTQLDIAIKALEEISKDEWEVISQSTGMRQSGPSNAALIAQKAFNDIITFMPEGATRVIGVDLATKDGDYSATTTGYFTKDGVLTITNVELERFAPGHFSQCFQDYEPGHSGTWRCVLDCPVRNKK